MSGGVEGVDRELFIFLLGFDAVKDEASFHRIRAGEFDDWEKMQRIAQFRAAASITAPPARTYAEGVQLAFRAGHRAARIRYVPAEPNGPTRFENVDWEDAAIRLLSQGEKA